MRQAMRLPRLSGPTTGAGVPGTDTNEASLELYLQRLEGQLDQLRVQVRQAQQLASLGMAAALIAHETRNLLQPQIAYAQYALDTDDPEMTRKALELTIRNGELLGRISERTLEMARGEAPDPQPTSVCEAAANAYQVIEYECQKKGVRFALEVPPDLRAWIDPACLQQVLFNLILNAYQALVKNRGGQLTIAGRSEGAWTVLEVRDTGPGIPPDLVDHVFEPMVSSKTTMQNGKSRCGGIGLTVCRSFVEEVGGTIAVASTPEDGTTFTIRLPARGSQAATG